MFYAALALVSVWICARVVFALLPGQVGLVDGKLRECPPSPNCVCSGCDDSVHAIEPFQFSGDSGASWRRLQKVIAAQSGMRIVRCDDDYLHATATTPILGFVDDLECRLLAGEHRIEIRSASRIGHSDLGANRSRVELLRIAFAAAAAN